MSSSSWLSLANLSDHYERKARLAPGLISVLPAIPAVGAFGWSSTGWVETLVGGSGVGVLLSILLSHLASAMGNQFQKKLWPNWPYDSPTNSLLFPGSEGVSKQQQNLWYQSIKRSTGIDIPKAVADGEEIQEVINDAVRSLRNILWDRPEAKRVQMHNIDYGFARNLAGLRMFWVPISIISTLICWAAYFYWGLDIMIYSAASTGISVISVAFAFWVLPTYVRTKAVHYAESFFGALLEIDPQDQG